MSAADEDVVIALSRPEELFTVDPAALLHGETRTVPGVVELVDGPARPLPGRAARSDRRHAAGRRDPAGTAIQLQAAIERYCRGRIADGPARQPRCCGGKGCVRCAADRSCSSSACCSPPAFSNPTSTVFWQNLLGNGVFLVIAWVGLWYPLDLLFFARQPLRREIQILEVLRDSPVELRPAIGPGVQPG